MSPRAKERWCIGSLVDVNGVHPNPDKVAAIAGFKTAVTVTQLHCFPGLILSFAALWAILLTSIAPFNLFGNRCPTRLVQKV